MPWQSPVKKMTEVVYSYGCNQFEIQVKEDEEDTKWLV